MKALSDIILPADLRYTDEHIWIKMDGEEAVAGISDFAQDQLGEVVYVDLPSEGDSFSAGDAFGEVESIKSVNKLFMPVDREVTGVNCELAARPTLLNVGCYDKAWLIRIKPANPADIDSLLDADAYKAVLAM